MHDTLVVPALDLHIISGTDDDHGIDLADPQPDQPSMNREGCYLTKHVAASGV